MLVQLSTALSCIWLCGLAGSQFVPGFGQRVGYGPYYGLGQGQGHGQGYNQVQGIGYGQGYGYLQSSAHPNLPRYGYNQLQAQAYANLQRQPYENLPGQSSQYLPTQGYPKHPIVGGFKKQISEVPPKQGHTQQQQREAWQNQIEQVVEVEEKLKNRARLGSGNTGSGNTGSGNTGSGNTGSGNTGSGNAGSGNTGSGNTGSGNTGSGNTGSGNTGRKNTRVEPAVSKPVETFEIIDLSDEKYKKVESVEKSEGLKVEEMKNQEPEVVKNSIEIQEPRLVLKQDSLYQKSSYIEEAEKFLSKFNEKQKLKNIVPASSESLTESSVAESIKPDVHGMVKAERLGQSQIKDILIENVKTKEGLKEIIRSFSKQSWRVKEF